MQEKQLSIYNYSAVGYPIVKVKTEDGLEFHGQLGKPKKLSDGIIIHIPGSAGSFYWNSFYPFLFGMAGELGYAFLSTNNRGSGVYEIESGTKPTGAAVEIFEECLYDIDAWMEFALDQGFKNIILEGHSFGTNKVQYYLLNGKYKDKIKAVILLGFTDSYGGQLDYLERNSLKNEDVLEEARKLISEGKPLQLLSNLYINWGELPQTAQSYISLMSPNSNLSKILPLRDKKSLDNFGKIQIPILGVVGDHNECTVISPQEAIDLLNKENKNAKCFMIKNSNHGYVGKEKELADIVSSFLVGSIQK